MNNNQNPYGYYIPENQIPVSVNQFEVRSEKSKLRRLSSIAGICVIGYIVLSTVVSLITGYLPAVLELYKRDLVFQNTYGIVVMTLVLMGPFYVAYLFQKNRSQADLLPLGKPHSKRDFFLAIPIGVFACFIGSYMTTYLVAFLSNYFNIQLTSPNIEIPVGVLGGLVFVLRSAFLPALVEEFAMRGVVMQPLRRYGDWFAILMSSLVFALMHGNMVQAPFAFIAGIAMGYFTIYTGTLWAGILIHFANNFISTMLSIVSQNLSSEVYTTLSLVVTNVVFGLGIVCAIIFLNNRKSKKLSPNNTPLTRSQRTVAYLTTVPMLIALAAMLYFTSEYINIGG